MKELDVSAELMTRSIELPNGHEGRITILPDRATWGEGSILAPELSHDQIETVARAAQDSLVVVSGDDLLMSGCTDGRNREGLLDGTEAPVWQKTVGTDLLTGFVMAEALGRAFYGDMVDAPVMERIAFFANFMKNNKDNPTAHEGCGARAGFPTIVSNLVRFVDEKSPLVAQAKLFGGNAVSDDTVLSVAQELPSRDYTGWDPDAVRRLVVDLSGPGAVKRLSAPHDHPNHGHQEYAKIRLWTPGVAFSARKYIEMMQASGDAALAESNAFSNNDDRVFRLASMIADGPEQEALARTAGLLYSEAGWATLGNGQYTVRIEDTQFEQK